MTFTTQKQVRQAFWQAHPSADRRKITSSDGLGMGKMYKTDTRVAFCDFVEYLRSDGLISEALAYRVTLEAR